MTFPDLSTILDLFFGAVNWEQRLQTAIKFVSPEGNEFSAKWRGNRRALEKKLGIYFYPKIAGNVVDDLDINSARFPITIYFEGKDNDINSRAFFAAAKERGVWEVTHPVHGFFGLQLVSISENTNPVESGNITAIDTEWIEPIDPDTLETDRELAGIVDGLGDAANLSALEQFLADVQQYSAAIQNAIETTTQGIGNVTDYLLSPLTTLSDEIYALQNATQNGIVDTLNNTILPLESLGGQIQNLVEFPVLATNDLNARLDAYGNLTDGLFTLLSGGEAQAVSSTAKPDGLKNNVATIQLAQNAGIVAFSQIAVTSPGIETRLQALEAAQALADNFDLTMQTLEIAQTESESRGIEHQFFAQSKSYGALAQLTNKAIKYLQVVAYDAKVERRITLKKARAVVELAVTEYGGFGENDANVKLFIESNKLKGDDVIMLPPGREVVIYD